MNIINVSKVNVKINDKLIIKNASFDIEENSFICFMGKNGSGKSILIKTLAGLFNYDGYINISGYVLDKDNISYIREGISVVLDDIDNEFMGETVFDDLIFNMENLRYSNEEILKRVKYISELFGISDILNKSVNYITNSQRQVLSIASSLVTNPKVLILDDCLHQLSVRDKKRVIGILKKYKKENKITIIMSSNDIEDVLNCDRAIVLNGGSVIYNGSVIGLLNDRKFMLNNGYKIPFVVDLSLRLMDNGVINHIYLDSRKLVRDLWK